MRRPVNPSASTSRRELLRIALATASAASLGACGDAFGFRGVDTGSPGGGGGGAAPPPAGASGLNAVAFLIAQPQPDGTTAVGVSLAVFVDLATTVRWAGGVTNPRLVVGTSELPLVTTQQAGLFQTAQQPSRQVAWNPQALYLFRFRVIDAEGTARDYELSITPPAAPPSIELPVLPIRFANEPVEMDVRGLADGAALRVTRLQPLPQRVQTDPFAFGPEATEVARAELVRYRGPILEVARGLVPDPGQYAIEVFNTRLQAGQVPTTAGTTQLGPRSWAAALFPALVVVELE